jgi:hypothetical protein
MQKITDQVEPEAFRIAAEWSRLGREATQETLAENRRLGVPNVYAINGRSYYELPNGELSLEDPGVSPPLNGASNGHFEDGASPT